MYLANTFLNAINGHPKLIDHNCKYLVYNNSFFYSDQDYVSFYDANLRTEFISRINKIILSIPQKTDMEVLFSLAETVAILKDGHSFVPLVAREAFMFDILPIYTDSTVTCYVNSTDRKYEKCLTARLDAINGISVDGILERLRPLISYESEQWFFQCALRGLFGKWTAPLTNCNLLRYIGIIAADENRAIFTFTNSDGDTFDIEAEAVKFSSIEMIDIVEYSSETDAVSDISLKLMHSDDLSLYWHKLLDDGSTLYVRINTGSVPESEVYLFEDNLREAISDAEISGSLNRIILDFRQNSGGYPGFRRVLIPLLNSIDVPCEKYILIDEGSYSTSIIIPALAKRFANDITLVGAPGGSPTNEIFSIYEGTKLPNLKFNISQGHDGGWNVWPGYTEDTLMPDEVVYQTYEDYLNGIDTVLAYICRQTHN